MNIHSLSTSMVNQYRQCPANFYYGRVERLPWLPNHFLAFGSAFHKTLEENYFQKVNSGKDLPVDLLTDFFAEDLEYRDVDWSQQSLDETKDQGVKTVRSYQHRIAPQIRPTEVEHSFAMEVKGRPWVISGKIDLIADDLLLENKTTGRKVSKPKPEHVFQTGTYTAARKAEIKREIKTRLVYSLRGNGEIYSHDIQFDKGLEAHIINIFDQVAKGIQAEVWFANRNHPYCNRKHCAFWGACEKDCGGIVAG